MCEKNEIQNRKQQIRLIGIGMGSAASMTREGAEAIEDSDCLIGARRMLEAAGGKAAVFCEYRAEEILSYIEANPEYGKIGVVLSGDTGFYSGAKKLAELLKARPEKYDIRLIPGVSSVACLAAKLGTSWEDAAVISLHGQDENFIQTVNRNHKTFLLLGGAGTGARMLRRLLEYGMKDVTVSIGQNMTGPDERIVTGHPGEIPEEAAEGLCAAMILNPHPDKTAGPHIRDEEFIRGDVPMTKAEVRAVSLAALELTEDAVV